jgi:hypothetical protein
MTSRPNSCKSVRQKCAITGRRRRPEAILGADGAMDRDGGLVYRRVVFLEETSRRQSPN